MSVANAIPLPLHRPATRQPRVRAVRRAEPIVVRQATSDDAAAIDALVSGHLAEGRLLPRTREEIAVHAHRFVVATQGTEVIACADLAPLSRTVAEVRSLVVSPSARSLGVGRRLVDELVHRAQVGGFGKLCAFTHSVGYFVEMGFSIVPHAWLPEKIDTDCRACAAFRRCGQYAVMLPLARVRQSCVPLAALHG